MKGELGLEQLIASIQLKKYLEKSMDFRMEWWSQEAVEALGDVFRSTRCLQDSATKSSGGLSDPGQRDCSHAWNILE